MKTLRRWLVGLCIALGAAVHAQQPLLTVLPPQEAAVPGAALRLDVVVLNPGPDELDHRPPSIRNGTLAMGTKTWPITLRWVEPGTQTVPREPAPVAAAIGAGRFKQDTYEFIVPMEATSGELTVRLDGIPAAGWVVRTDGGTAGQIASDQGGARPAGAAGMGAHRRSARSGLVPRPAASRIERTFREHFGTHEPVYFIYGAEEPGAKFQLSFKYRILGDASDLPETTRNSIQFGYTQRSMWDIGAESSPFYDTSYMPEVFIEHLTPEDLGQKHWFKWLGVQAGYKHESNGREEIFSRSMNALFVRSGFVFGNLEGWRVIVEPRAHTYIADMSENPDMKHYRGYGELRLLLGKNDAYELLLTGRVGSDWSHPTIQADFTVPLRWKFGDFASYFMVQYFYGYAESLLYYREKTESLRGGFSFVR